MPARAVERVRDGEDEAEVRRDYPTGDLEVLGKVLRYTGRDMEGDAPRFGSIEYVESDAEGKSKAETRAGLAWLHAGDTLDERAQRADVEEERAAAADIARDLREQRHPWDNRSHSEVLKARGEDVDEQVVRAREPEPERDTAGAAKQLDTNWVRAAEAASQRVDTRAEDPPRDDLAEQLERAKETLARTVAENDERHPSSAPHIDPVEREDAER